MKKILWLIVCLMTMVLSVNAHNVHYPTYTEDGITYVKNGTWTYDDEFGGHCEPWDVQKVDKPNDKTITIPRAIMINGEKIRIDGIRENAFATCVALDSLIISDGVMIGNCFRTFKGCNELEYLYYSQGGYCGGWNCGDGRGPVTDMTYSGLKCKTLETTAGCAELPFWQTIGGSLEKLIIRDSNNVVSRMDEYCPNLKTIVCYSATPPFTGAARSRYSYTCAGGYITFNSKQWSTITLYVPRESLEKYYFDRVWGEIDNIYAIDEMETIEYDGNTTTNIISIQDNIKDYWYSLDGKKVDKPSKGIYIKNGKKILNK